MRIRVPDLDYVTKVIDEAEDQLLRRAGYCFLLEVVHVDEGGINISAVRNDGARASFRLLIPAEGPPEKLSASQRCRRDRLWFRNEINNVIESLCLGIVEDEPEAAAQPEPEQRFAVVIAFGGRADVVLTPERGVPVDEAVRVYGAFLAGAAAVGGRPAMLPLGA